MQIETKVYKYKNRATLGRAGQFSINNLPIVQAGRSMLIPNLDYVVTKRGKIQFTDVGSTYLRRDLLVTVRTVNPTTLDYLPDRVLEEWVVGLE